MINSKLTKFHIVPTLNTRADNLLKELINKDFLDAHIRNKLAAYEGMFSDEELNDIVFRIINEGLYELASIFSIRNKLDRNQIEQLNRDLYTITDIDVLTYYLMKAPLEESEYNTLISYFKETYQYDQYYETHLYVEEKVGDKIYDKIFGNINPFAKKYLYHYLLFRLQNDNPFVKAGTAYGRIK